MLITSSDMKVSSTRTIRNLLASLIFYLVLGGCSQQLSNWCPWTEPEIQQSETVTVTVYLPTVMADLSFEKVSGEQNQVVIPTENQHTLTLATASSVTSAQIEPYTLSLDPLTAQRVTLNFDVGSDTLVTQEQQKLREFLNGINLAHVAHVDIIGHTDSTGTHQLNKALSIRRAQGVANITQQFVKIPIEIHAFGEERPLVDNKTSAHRAINRRVNLIIQ